MSRPDLRPAILLHQNCYPDLANWINQQTVIDGSPAVSVAQPNVGVAPYQGGTGETNGGPTASGPGNSIAPTFNIAVPSPVVAAPTYAMAPTVGYPGYAPAPIMVVRPPSNGLGIGGMVCGIIGLVFGWVPWLGIPLAVIGAALSGAGIATASKRGVGKGAAVAGLVCSVIALALWIIVAVTVGNLLTGL